MSLNINLMNSFPPPQPFTQEAEMLRVRRGVCELREAEMQIEFPSSVEALVTSRMDRLPTPLQQLMKMAS
ncbi:MAG: hypothetical protein SGPRY_012409, partial [Prymnesium sp.]